MTQLTATFLLTIISPIVAANNDRIQEFVANFNNLVTVNQNLGLALEQQAEANAAQIRVTAEQSAVIANYNSTVETLNTRLQEQQANLEENRNIMEALNNTVQEQKANNEALNTTVQEQKTTIEDNKNTMEALNTTVQEQKTEMEKLKTNVHTLNQTEGKYCLCEKELLLIWVQSVSNGSMVNQLFKYLLVRCPVGKSTLWHAENRFWKKPSEQRCPITSGSSPYG